MMPVSESDPPIMSKATIEQGESSAVDTKLESKEDVANDNASKENYYIKNCIVPAVNGSFKTSDKTIKNDSKPFKIKEISNRDSKHNSKSTSKHNSTSHESKHNSTSELKHNSTSSESKHNSTSELKHNSTSSESKHNSTSDLKHNSTSSESKHNSISELKLNSTSSESSKHNSHRSTDKKRSSDDRHRSDRHHSNSHRSSDKKRDEHRSGRKHHSSEETLKSPCLLCYSCGRKENKKWVHSDCANKCCRSTTYYCDSCLRHKIVKNDHNNELIRDVNFNKYMYVVVCPTGRGSSLHMDYERIMHLRSAEQREVAIEFLKQAFKEDDKGFAHFTIAIVHNGARYMPDMLKMLAKLHPTLKVNTTKLKSSTETELTDLSTYYKKVKETYNNGTYAYDPLNETQAACVKNADECGAYLPEMLSLLEKSPFLSQVLPWGDFTTKRFKTPHESDDGPIFWCRPGEQIVSLDRNSQRNRWNSSEIESFLRERRKNICLNDEKKLIVEELKKYRRSCSAREFLFEDRTRPHADQAWSNSFEATAAVGVIQAIHPDERPDYNRICKDIVVFQAKHLEMLEALLHIDTTAAPKQQCAEWLDDAKLNMIRQMNIQFSKLYLRDNDIYFIPRKIVHQFKTVSATLSIAWHTRIQEYYEGRVEAEMNNVEVPSNLPEEKVDKKKTKNSHPRSRSSSVGSRGRHNSRPRAKKRKNKSHRSRSPCKRIKEEPPANCDESKKSEITDGELICEVVPNDCGSVPVPVKSEPKDEESGATADAPRPQENETKSSVKFLCPRVEIVDIGAHMRGDNSTGSPKCNEESGETEDIEMEPPASSEQSATEQAPVAADASPKTNDVPVVDEKAREE